MGKLTIEVTDEDIVDYVADKRDHQIKDIIAKIEVKVSSWDLTKTLTEYFLDQVRHCFDTSEEFEAFLNETKEQLCEKL